MAFDIEDQATIDLAQALAAREGLSVEEVVKLALKQWAEKASPPSSGPQP